MGLKRLISLAFLLFSSSVLGACPGTRVDEKGSNTRIDLAVDFLARRQLENAEAEAQKGLALNPKNEVGHNVLGLVEFLRALNNFRLIEVDDCLTGVDADALRLEMDQHLEAADKHFARAAELASDYGEAWSNRGAVALRLENHRAAAGHFNEALARPHRLEDIGVTRANLGWAHFLLGEHVLAAKELRQAIQFNPAMCVAKYRLGRVYFARKEWNKALEQFRAVAADAGCPIHEANLYVMKTLRETGLVEELDAARAACVAPAPKSCIAAECRSISK